MIAVDTAHGQRPSGAVEAIRGGAALQPQHFALAVALGLANMLYVSLTVASAEPRDGWSLRTALVLVPVAGTLWAQRRGRQAWPWLLLAAVYASLALFIVAVPWRQELVIGQLMGHGIVAAVWLLEARCPAARLSLRRYAMAGAGGIALGALAWALVLGFGPASLRQEVYDAYPSAALPVLHPLYVALHWLLFGGAVVLLYAEQRLARSAVGRLRDAELRRAERSREIAESQLQTLQARVEPQFLLDALAAIRARRRDNDTAAEHMLDDLAAFLRAAIPHMRDTASTLAREAELLRAYLGVCAASPGRKVVCSMEVDHDAAGARLPPMVLLPVVTATLDDDDRGAGEHHVRVIGTRKGERLGVRVTTAATRCRPALPEEQVACLRERLRALYRGDAALEIGYPAAGVVSVSIDIPFVASPQA